MRRLAGAIVSLLLPLAGSAAADCSLTPMAELPVTMVDSAPLVKVKINGLDTHLTVDSGASLNTLARAKAQEFGLDVVPTGQYETVVGVGGGEWAKAATVKEFTFAGSTFKNIPFLVAPGEFGTDVAGLLGRNFLNIGDDEFDLAHGMVRIFRARDCGKDVLAYWGGTYSAAAMGSSTPDDNDIVVDVYINDVKVRAVVDSGAGYSMLSLAAARRAGIDPKAAGVTDAGVTEGVGRRLLQTWSAPVTSFRIGDEQILHTRLRLAEFSQMQADMFLGADFLLSHRVMVARSQNRLYLSYVGGPVFDLSASPHVRGTAPEETAGAPADASGLGRRGAAFASRGEDDKAVGDYTRAMALAPADADYPLARGRLLAAQDKRVPALADFDLAVKLAPEAVGPRLERASLRLRDGDQAAAVGDLDVADKRLPPVSDQRLALGHLYLRADAFEAAIRQYDAWIASNDDNPRLAEALAERCAARGISGKDTTKGLGDCEAALKRAPDDTAALDGRGLIRLRSGQYDRAIADFDKVLEAAPKSGWALFGRGLARQKQGQDGKADLAAATAIDAQLPERAKTYGLAP